MRASLERLFYSLPSVEVFLDDLVDSLLDGVSCLIVFPANVAPPDLDGEIRHRVSGAQLHYASVPSVAPDEESSLITVLGEYLGLSWPPAVPHTARNLADILIEQDDSDIVIGIEGLGELPVQHQRSWFEFIVKWTDLSHAYASQHQHLPPIVLSLSASELDLLPRTSPRLSIAWWWGFPSMLELQLLCRFVSEPRENRTRLQWRETILPALAGQDIGLMAYLWDSVFEDFDTVFIHMRAYSTEVFTESLTMDLNLISLSGEATQSTQPPSQLHRYWQNGLIGWCHEYGTEVHPLILLRWDRVDDLRHRLWRAQAQLMLPTIDKLRIEFCDELTRRFGKDWPFRWGCPPETEVEAARDDPRNCQWGYLWWLISRVPDLREFRDKWHARSACARTVRNSLAHYKPVSFADFERLVDTYQVQ